MNRGNRGYDDDEEIQRLSGNNSAGKRIIHERSTTSGFQWWYVPAGLLILFPYISIIALFAMYTNVNSTENALATSTFSQALPTHGKVGQAVSFTSNGKLQVGAGTSLYNQITGLSHNANCPEYLSLVAVTDNIYLYSYGNKAAHNAVLTTIQLNSTATTYQVLPKDTLTVSEFIYENVVLSQDSGIFVSITQEYNQQVAYVVAGRVNVQTGGIMYDATKKAEYAKIYSVNPSIIRLSDTSFAIAYYDYTVFKIVTKYGKVDPSTYEITLSGGQSFAEDSKNSTYYEIAPLTTSEYMLLYYDGHGETYTGPLSATLAYVTDPSDPLTTKISLSNTSTLTSSLLNYYFTTTSLDNNTIAIAYTDANENNAVVVQTVEVFRVNNNEITFGSKWIVNSGASYTMLQTGLMDLDIVTVSENQEFLVLYSDVSNHGAITATLGQKSAGGALTRTAPDFVLDSGNDYNINTVHAWGSIAAEKTDYLASQTAILTMLASSDCSITANANMAILEKFPRPVGVITPSTSSSSNTIAVAGNVNNAYQGLSTSHVYYTTTKGNVITVNGLYPGWEGTSTNQPNDGLIYDDVNHIFITTEAQVGVALGTDTMLVKMN